jgi:NAD(P)H-dependent flavin oxidoreductase YrpB (nitropropane dioxygenase family)
MTFKPLKISKNKIALKPIIQGGMAVKVSTAQLAAAVANCGGVGLIAASGLTESELRSEIRLAKKMQLNKSGLIGINIMFAASDFSRVIEIAIDENIDLIVFGAGFSRDIFEIGKSSGIPIVPIVSSKKLAVIAKKKGATAIIVESGEAGGHLGTCHPIKQLIPEIRQALNEISSEEEEEVSLIAAGGITSGSDMIDIFNLGATGVQMATRFILSDECTVDDNFKKLYVNSSEKDLILITSPVGLQARAISTEFSRSIVDETVQKPKRCVKCLKHCSHSFCIIESLRLARDGNMENGLFFAGENLNKYNDILPVNEIFNNLEREANEYQKKLKETNFVNI